MEITITTRHHTLDAKARSYFEAKLSKLGRLFDRLTSVTAIINKEHDDFVVEVTASAPSQHRFAARAENSVLRHAMDQVDQKVEAQVRAYKDKLVDHRNG